MVFVKKVFLQSLHTVVFWSTRQWVGLHFKQTVHYVPFLSISFQLLHSTAVVVLVALQAPYPLKVIGAVVNKQQHKNLHSFCMLFLLSITVSVTPCCWLTYRWSKGKTHQLNDWLFMCQSLHLGLWWYGFMAICKNYCCFNICASYYVLRIRSRHCPNVPFHTCSRHEEITCVHTSHMLEILCMV